MPIALGALASTLLLSAPAAGAAGTVAAGRPHFAGTGTIAPRSVVSRLGLQAGPASRVLDDQFSGDSCTTQPDNPSIRETCLAVGTFVSPGYVNGLVEDSTNGTWYNPPGFGGIGTVTAPIEVSCAPQLYTIPSCVAVGEHFTNYKYPTQIAAYGDSGFTDITERNPKGATWSVLDDVSCVNSTSVSFCMLVGEDGTTRTTSHGLYYVAHANAYTWNGSALHRLTIPAPAHAKTTELDAVSCPTPTSCMAAGNYTSATGKWLPYSARWTSGTWHLQPLKTISGKGSTDMQAVSCSAPGTCIAVGDAVKPGSSAFAEQYSGGQWSLMAIAPRTNSTFFSISCPITTYCVAAGHQGTRSLIEAWNGTKWSGQAVPATAAPMTVDALAHVSCLTADICTAVGFSHNPSVRYSYHTLAVGWNGSAWKIEKTTNQ